MEFKFHTPDCMGGAFRDVAPCDVPDWPNIGLLYTVLSLTQSLSIFVSSLLLCPFGPYSGNGLLYRGFTIILRNRIRQNDSARVISPTPDNTQQSQEEDIHGPSGFEPTIPVIERPQTSARRQRSHWPRLLTKYFLIFGSQSQTSTPVSSSQKTEAERYSKHSACLYVTSPSTAILMVLSRLSCDLVKIGYFAFGLTVHSCSGNSCSGR